MALRVLAMLLATCFYAVEALLGTTHGTFKTEQGGVQLGWELAVGAGGAPSVTFTLQANATGFVALGFGTGMSDVMKGSGTDMVICWVDQTGDPHAVDSYSTGHDKPKPDVDVGGTNNVEVLSGRVDNGVMQVTFRRLLNTSDRFDAVIPAEGAFDTVFAWHDGVKGDIVYHDKQHTHINLDLSKPDGMPSTGFGDDQRGVSARSLVKLAAVGTLATLNVKDGSGAAGTAGFPYASVAGFADFGDGRPVVLLSQLERNVINQESDPRCSLAIPYPESLMNGTDVMASPRVTLMGRLRAVPADDHKTARTAYLAKHPQAEMWIDFNDFALYFFEPLDVYWVGGFGGSHFIGWVAPADYFKATPKDLIVAPPSAVDMAFEYAVIV